MLAAEWRYIQTDQSYSVAAYECAVADNEDDFALLAVGGPNGWTNYGHLYNHRVGFMTPVPVGAEGWVIVCEMQWLMAQYSSWVVISLGASSPSRFDPETPGYVDGADTDLLVPCEAQAGYINDEFAVEELNYSQVKALFD